MIKEKSYSSYILPVRKQNGIMQVALLDYGGGNYGPIGGRLDEDEDFLTALRRELIEELGEKSLTILDNIIKISTPYSFRHTNIERAEKRGAFMEEHYFFIGYITKDIDLEFCENRPEKISVVWLNINDLTNPDIIKFDDEREYFATYVIPEIK